MIKDILDAYIHGQNVSLKTTASNNFLTIDSLKNNVLLCN